ncbi:MAG: hypothetical protein DRN49_05810 [Thaumarchaeota archaeon]|nr:MAG: hypothetical protein DRN49_05810 [Nitrososphaerota archaeon]
MRSTALQWFIILTDNRVSGARRGVKAYWRKNLKKILDETIGESKPHAKQIIKMSENAIEN